jgi:hypothetical protein
MDSHQVTFHESLAFRAKGYSLHLLALRDFGGAQATGELRRTRGVPGCLDLKLQLVQYLVHADFAKRRISSRAALGEGMARLKQLR